MAYYIYIIIMLTPFFIIMIYGIIDDIKYWLYRRRLNKEEIERRRKLRKWLRDHHPRN